MYMKDKSVEFFKIVVALVVAGHFWFLGMITILVGLAIVVLREFGK